MNVLLTESEIDLASQIGLRRAINARLNKHNVYKEEPYMLWSNHIEGACAEIAFCKAMNLYWGKVLYKNYQGADISNNIQIRYTQHSHGRIILRKGYEKEDHNFVLVTGMAPNYKIVGWIKGVNGMKDEYLTDPKGNRPPAYFVPQSVLKPINELEIK